MKTIIWLVGDRIIPGVGRAVVGREIKCEKSIANSLIEQGIATDKRISKKEKEIIDGGNR